MHINGCSSKVYLQSEEDVCKQDVLIVTNKNGNIGQYLTNLPHNRTTNDQSRIFCRLWKYNECGLKFFFPFMQKRAIIREYIYMYLKFFPANKTSHLQSMVSKENNEIISLVNWLCVSQCHTLDKYMIIMLWLSQMKYFNTCCEGHR